MFDHCCATCEYLFEVCDGDPGNIRFCPHSHLPRLVLDLKGKAIKWDPVFARRFRVDVEKGESGEDYDIFDDLSVNSPECLEPLKDVFQGRRVRLNLPQYRFPQARLSPDDLPAPPEDFHLFLLPLKNEGTMIAVGSVYYGQSEARCGLYSESACRLIGDLIRSISEIRHDLNNPILLIMGNAQLMLSKSSELSPDSRRKVQKILAGAEKIRTALEQFRVSTGPLHPSRDDNVSLD